MIREVLLVHHSHTDIGYTHPQPVIFELHNRFIDHALQLAEDTRDWRSDCRFKWTCEATGITLDWWRQASSTDQQRFMAAVEAKQFEVAAMAWNITPLADDRMLLKLLEPIAALRAEGIPIRSAMNSDVNGLPWGVVDSLLDYAVDNLSMGINEHYGCAPQPRPRGFWWESPRGRKILVWNGLQYWNAANIQMRIPESIDAVRAAMPPFLKVWEDRGYPYSFLPVQITTATAPDNAGPDPKLSEFVREWNAAAPDVRLRMVTLSDIFEMLRRENLPLLRGDWTDWWNFGSGSTARETTLTLTGQRLLDSAAQMRAWPGAQFPRDKALFDEAQRNLALFVEHTWGADRSVSTPSSWETEAQLNQKLGFAYRGYLQARMLRRDGLEKLAQRAGGDALTALFYNPLPFAVRRTLQVPLASSEFSYLAEPALHLPHRQDVALADLPAPAAQNTASQWIGPVEIPALGYVTWPYLAQAHQDSDLAATRNSISNGRITVHFAEDRAGLVDLTLDGISYARRTGDFYFGEPVLERPESGRRGAIFGPLDWRELDVYLQWHRDWQATYEKPTQRLSARHALVPGCAEYEQTVVMSTGDELVLTYRVFPEEWNIELTVVVHKQPLETPHSLYLPLPLGLKYDSARCHFATAGAVVEFDKEQMPFASRHYVTAQRFIRVQDDTKGLTVACPDAPLWQIGGFTFGRDQASPVVHKDAMLAAWLTNNYWDVNFCANQGGVQRFRFRLIPHASQCVADSLRQATTYEIEPQPHIYRNRGPVRQPVGQLLDLDLGGALLTSLEAEDGGLALTVLNPSDNTEHLRIASAVFEFTAASQTNLAGALEENLPVANGATQLSLSARAWSRVRLTGANRV